MKEGRDISATFPFDVALSFAGEDRTYVDRVAAVLKEQGIKVFYDRDEEVELWGKDLYAHLSEVYHRRARYTVMFISHHYAVKHWTNHERRSAQARAFTESQEYILPARFDQTEIPGVLPTTGYLDLSDMSPEELADRIVRKVRGPAEYAVPPAGKTVRSSSRGAAALLTKVQSRSTPVAQCVAEALPLAQDAGDAEFAEFCVNELSGWPKGGGIDQERLRYRLLEAYCSYHQVNPSFIGWNGDPARMLAHMKANPGDFIQTFIAFAEPIADLERRARNTQRSGVLSVTQRFGQFDPSSKTPDEKVYCYLRADGFEVLVDAVRGELTKRLLRLV